eukprot:gnl/TRDRNA2_/TRDRNA2_141719_c2_seq1.p1 gnl/TRDRNA2_/TRDRNA2_141719_c2~~gnl/TRDRNA2_/TRDRNA2_141719_c2_seq1.p1  ORF type:complete len:278 (-),score=55.42 gnl/TRDRNA2_/TRDRNA2_141719_c2_seq1:242-1075(-)
MALAAVKPMTLRDLWVDSVMLSNTLVGRDKSMRAWQYFFRFLFGLTGNDLFGNACKTMAVSRKTLRFYKPVKVAKAIDDVLRDPNMDETERKLTLVEVFSDGFYALMDHFAFLQRIGGLNWMTPKQVDNLDRFIECFWFTEVVPVICRELRTYFILRAEESGRRKRRHRTGGDGSGKRRPSEALVSPMVSYPSSSSMGPDEAGNFEAPTAYPSSTMVSAKARLNKLLLFKAIFLDMPCIMYMLQPASFKNKRVNRMWCGFLGVIASFVSLHINWPKK